jgi:hypothetical protein
VAISSDGTLALSPAYEQVEGIAATYVWSLAQDPAFNLYAGTGDKGIIYKMSGTKKAEEFCKIPEQHVLSLAFDKAGNLLGGTAPKGIIYKVTPAGEVSVFAQTKENYVWALAWSRDSEGVLYAATGPHGKIFKILPSGEAKPFVETGQNHVLCMAFDKDSNLYAGTEPSGLIYKIAPDGKAFVIYDAAEGDVHSLAFDAKGNLYASTATPGEVPAAPVAGMVVMPAPGGAMAVQPPTPEGARTPEQHPARAAMPLMRMPAEMPSPALPPPTVSAKNSIYKIAPDGRVTQVLTLERTMLLSLAIVGNDLWAGAGNASKLYRVSLDNPARYEVVMDPDELQVVALLPLAANSPQGTLAIATGNLGHVYRMKEGFAQRGTLVSPVFDTSSISQWGAISWEGDVPPGASLSVSTRTGNSSKYDKTWSDWSRGASAPGMERIQSPAARFIQLRATLTSSSPGKTPLIREIKVPYLTFNMPPLVSKLTIDGSTGETKEGEKAGATSGAESAADKLQKMVSAAAQTTVKAAAPTPGAIPAHKVQRSVTWQAKDPDGDKLKSILFYRGLEEKEWKLLKDDLTATTYTWDTETVPDGEYVLKVVASDEPSNPPDKALKADMVSEPLLIDNTRPTVEALKATPLGDGRWKIQGRTEDALSTILEIQYSVDAKDWVSIYPTSGIFDSKKAAFEFTLDGLSAGEHTVAIKATDAAGNPGLGKVVFH